MNIKQRNRIEDLKEQIRNVVGYNPVFGCAPDCPPEIEEAFLKRVLWYEMQSKEPLRVRLERAGMRLKNPAKLDDANLKAQLWKAIGKLVSIEILPVNTDHLSDRQMYERLWEMVIGEETATEPHFFSRGWYLDFTTKPGDDGLDDYLRYYATSDERDSFAAMNPDDPIPDHVDPPYDRDRLLPDFEAAPPTPEVLKEFK